MQLIKLYWGQGFSLNGLTDYIADLSKDNKRIQLRYTLEKLNIPTMDKRYANVLRLSNKEYNDKFTCEMSKRLKEAKEIKKQQQEGEAIYIPKGPLSQAHREHISQGLKKYYQEHPEKIYEMSKRQKDFYEQHPEKKQEFSQVLTYAWNNTKEGANLAKHISKFAKRYYGLEITSDELALKKEMNSNKSNALSAFWDKNKWANKELSIAMTKAWENIKADNRSIEEIYNYRTIKDEQLVVDLIPQKVRIAMNAWIIKQGYDLKDFVFCKALIHKTGNKNIEELQQLVNEKSQKIVDRYNNQHIGLNDMIANALQCTIVEVMNDLSNKDLKIPKEIRKDEAKLTALMLIFTQHMKDKPIYRIANNKLIPISGIDISYLTDIYVNMANYSFLMGSEDFSKYLDAKFNKYFDEFYNQNPIKLN